MIHSEKFQRVYNALFLSSWFRTMVQLYTDSHIENLGLTAMISNACNLENMLRIFVKVCNVH